MKPLRFTAIVLMGLMGSAFCANADSNTSINPIAAISTFNDSLGAAAILSLGLSLIGVAIFILFLIVDKKPAESEESAERTAGFEKERALHFVRFIRKSLHPTTSSPHGR
jgi:hypothetical protein